MTPNPKECSQVEMNHQLHCALVFSLSPASHVQFDNPETVFHHLKTGGRIFKTKLYLIQIVKLSHNSPQETEQRGTDQKKKKKIRGCPNIKKVGNHLHKSLVNKCILKFPISPTCSCSCAVMWDFIGISQNGNDPKPAGSFSKQHFPQLQWSVIFC